ncbi:MAG: DUF169 domain-containing protein [Armatimonadota bacterium]|nr:DUF169 domain-containing protein [bacterium]
MDSRIAEELKLRYSPVAVLLSDEKPEGALQFREGVWGCVVAMFTAAVRGKVTALDKLTVACGGGSIGLGFCEQFAGPPGGIEYFLSTGRGEGYPEGEAYLKTPEFAKAFVDQLPRTEIPYTYVIFKPLDQVDPEKETPVLVSFLANPDQLSALVVLANYDRASTDNVIVRFGAGCHQIFLLPYAESLKEEPRAVIGITDITARPYIDPDLLAFTMPWKMFNAMESNIPGSFLEKKDWKKVRERIS